MQFLGATFSGVCLILFAFFRIGNDSIDLTAGQVKIIIADKERVVNNEKVQF